MPKPSGFSELLDFMKPNRSRILWTILVGIPIILATVAGVTTWITLEKSLPSLDQLEQIEPRLITTLYDKDSNLVHEFFVEKRIWTPMDSIPKIVPQAVMAIEDQDFPEHWGLNLYAIPSVIAEAVLKGKRLRGASTLTQQLAKNLFLTPERKLVRKIKEAMTAVRIENTYTKEEILEFYLNQVYLGGGNYGFQSACRFYFGHSLDSIRLDEAAILAAMLKMPERLRPDRFPAAAKKRRNTVLFAMRDAGFIDEQAYQSALAKPIEVSVAKKDTLPAGAYFVEEVRKRLEKKYGEDILYNDGISIHTTMNADLQRAMEKILLHQLDSIQRRLNWRTTRQLHLDKKFNLPRQFIVDHFDSMYTIFDSLYLSKDTASDKSKRRYPDSVRYLKAQAAAVLIDNSSGAIRAMVGGRNFEESKFNRATQAYRQPGSSFKPIVYATAMDNGANPGDSVNDQPITIPDPMDPKKTWRPDNYGKKFSGYMTYRQALYKSKNLPAIQIGIKYGLNNVVHYARKMGLRGRLSAVPSLSIGSIGATLLEMTSAYTTFPNGGTRIEPYMIESLVDKNGEVIEKNFKVETEVLQKASAYLMVSMLKDVNQRGTAAKVWASGFYHPSGGKTGTTNDYTDAWYIGFTRHYTMGVWVGIDSHLPMGRGHTGGQDAAPIWIGTMKYAHKNLPKLDFEVPQGIAGVTLCAGCGGLAGKNCVTPVYEIFHWGSQPTESCDGVNASSTRDTRNATMFGEDDGRQVEQGVRKTF